MKRLITIRFVAGQGLVQRLILLLLVFNFNNSNVSLFRLFRLILQRRKLINQMETYNNVNKASKEEQRVAIQSYDALSSVIKKLKSNNPEIEIDETQERIKIPLSALKLLGEILEAMSKGKPFSLVPIATEVTTQKAAEILGCSRPHFVKLLEEGKIDFTKVGKHRRVKFEDVMKHKRKMKEAQKKHLIEIMQSDEEIGLYDT